MHGKISRRTQFHKFEVEHAIYQQEGPEYNIKWCNIFRLNNILYIGNVSLLKSEYQDSFTDNTPESEIYISKLFYGEILWMIAVIS
jgi:hypothetical protein